MKTKIAIINTMLIILVFTITGCSGNSNDTSPSSFKDAEYVFASGVYADDYILYEDDGRLYFKDLKTDTEAVLCGNADCEHELYSLDNPNPSCFGVVQFSSCYVIDGSEMYYVDLKDVMTQNIYYSDSIGVTKSVLMTVEGVTDTIAYDYDNDNKRLVFTYKLEYEKEREDYIPLEKPKVGIMVVDLKNQKYQKYLEHDGTGVGIENYTSTMVFLNDDKIIYYKSYYDGTEDDYNRLMDEDVYALMEDMKFTLCEYSPSSQKEEELLTIANNDILTFDRNIMSYVDGEDYVCFDIANRQEYRIEGYGRSWLDFYNGDMLGFHYLDNEETIFCTYDIKTNSVQEVYKYYESNKAINYLTYTKESVFLCIYDTEDGSQSIDIQMKISDYINGNFENLKWEEK